MGSVYYLISIYYRRSSVETKRLDSLLRSILYGSYSGNIFLLVIRDLLADKYRIPETLTGLSTIRAYREQAGRLCGLYFIFRFLRDTESLHQGCRSRTQHGKSSLPDDY
jgi:hypothetical protein